MGDHSPGVSRLCTSCLSFCSIFLSKDRQYMASYIYLHSKSLPPEQREDLFPTSTIKTMSPSVAKEGQVCWQSPLEDQGSSVWGSSAVRLTHHVHSIDLALLFIIPLRLQKQGNSREHTALLPAVLGVIMKLRANLIKPAKPNLPHWILDACF